MNDIATLSTRYSGMGSEQAVPQVYGDRELVTIAASAPQNEIISILHRDGAVILSDFLSEDELSEIKNDIDPHFPAQGGGGEQARENTENYLPALTKRLYGLVAKSKACRKLVLHEKLLAICDGMLLPNCYNYQLNVTGALQIAPGEKEQVLHRDDLCWVHPYPKPDMKQNFMFAITDFTKENGATNVVPGSHLWHRERIVKPTEIKYAEMKRGSVLVYTGSVIHGGGANRTSSEYRTGLVLSYVLGWLRQEENQYLTVPPEMAKTFEPQLQALLGYQVHEPFLGWVNNLEDPKTMLV